MPTHACPHTRTPAHTRTHTNANTTKQQLMKNSKWTKQRLFKPAEVFSCLYMLLVSHSEFKLGGSFIIYRHSTHKLSHVVHTIQTYLENIKINVCSGNTVIIFWKALSSRRNSKPRVSLPHIGDTYFIRFWIWRCIYGRGLRSWWWGIDQMKAHCLCSPLLHYEGHHIILDGWLMIREAWFWFDELYMKSAPFNPLLHQPSPPQI